MSKPSIKPACRISAFCIALLLALSQQLFAQQRIPVTGVVSDAQGQPLEGVSVTIGKSSSATTTTDASGKFRVELNSASTLVFSLVGYNRQEVPVTNSQPLKITLTSLVSDLEEIVVVGFGTTKKVNLTGAVTAVSGEEVAKRQVGQTSMALQGMAPGVTITQGSGQPGVDGGTIRIRGIGTLNNSNPLVLVDGVVMSLDNIDVSSIESISVLKDAASSAIYGSRAANGVILVTTKRGKSGQFSFSYDTYVGKQQPTDLPRMVGGLDHMNLINEAHVNVGRSPLFPQEYITNYIANKATDPDKYPDVDWQNELLQGSGIMQNHALGITGGTDKLQFFGSFGYLNQDGIIDRVNYQRYFFRLNTNVQINPKLRGSFDLFVRNNNRRSVTNSGPFTGPGALSASTSSGLIFGLMNKLPATQAARYTNGLFAEGQNGANPLAIIENGGWWQETSTPIAGNFALEYKPLKSLTARVAYAPNYAQPLTRSFNNVVKTYDANGTLRFSVPGINELNEDAGNDRSDQIEATLNFSKELGKHSLSALAGYQYLTGRNSGFNAFRDNFLFPDYTVLSAGSSTNMRNGGSASDWTLISYFGRVGYNYLGRYLAEANIRYDGSSRFAQGNKWGVFPSFSAGWRLSEESFMAGTRSYLDDLKLRVSWGRLGNQEIGSNYPFAPTVSLDPKYISEDAVRNGAAIMSLANTAISWETTEMTNFGLDMRLFKDFSVTFDYYRKITRGILLELSIPKTMGVGAPFQNAGVVENNGWDLQLDYAKKIGAFRYSATATLSDVLNKVVDIKGIQQTGTIVNREGYPINSLFLLRSQGLLSSADFGSDGAYLHAKPQFGVVAPGDIRYLDIDNNNIVNNNDREVLGSTIPRYSYSLNLSVGYGAFDLSGLLQGVGKRDGYLSGSAITPFLLGGTAYEYQKDRWTPETPNAVLPRFAFGESHNTQNSDFWMRSAAYLRVKNLQLGYTVPKSILQRIGVQGARLYVSGENLFTFDGFWPGWDPEISANSNGAYYPQVSTYTIGLNLKL
jgi:TonB-linked SusC/RagA family outer membrane protein